MGKIGQGILGGLSGKVGNVIGASLPKYDAVSTHIGRRSFATNYYGKINTALLISATGHSSESQFLRYVGKTANENALALAKAMRQLAEMEGQKPEMKVIKSGTK